MTELDQMLEAANPVPETGPGSEVSVPPFEQVWAAAQTPVKPRPRFLRPPAGGHVGRARRRFALASVSALAAGIAAPLCLCSELPAAVLRAPSLHGAPRPPNRLLVRSLPPRRVAINRNQRRSWTPEDRSSCSYSKPAPDSLSSAMPGQAA